MTRLGALFTAGALFAITDCGGNGKPALTTDAHPQ